MRNIKFKGKFKGAWIYASTKNPDDLKNFLCLVNLKTVCQCTGVKDRKKVDIYEGDILGYCEDESNTVMKTREEFSKKERDEAHDKIVTQKDYDAFVEKFYIWLPLQSAYYVAYDNESGSFEVREKLLNDDDFYTDNEPTDLIHLGYNKVTVVGNIHDKIKFNKEQIFDLYAS